MLGASPWWLHSVMSRPFTFERSGMTIPVRVTLRNVRAGELLNSDVQADAFVVCDARPLTAAGIRYLMKFDRFISDLGESYTVQEARVSFDGETPVFLKAFVRGATT